jgi:hypothetical protein
MSHSPNKKSSSSKKQKPIVNARATSSSSSATFRPADTTSSSSSAAFRPADIEFVETIKEKYKIQVPESYLKKQKKDAEVVEIEDETSVDVVAGILSKYYKDYYANYFRICEFG